MKQLLLSGLVFSLALSVAACSTNPSENKTASMAHAHATQANLASNTLNTNPNNLPAAASGQPIGGNIAMNMDSIDKNKLSHALDKPIGKSTQWTNANNGISYTVLPTERVAVNGNSFCRKYTLTSMRNSKTRETQGVACVGSDSNWQMAD